MNQIESYIAGTPSIAQRCLRSVYDAVREAAPDADEVIAYGMPTIKQNGLALVSFAAFKAHIGFYPGAAAIKKFAVDLRPYETAKGSVRFPLDKPMPIGLIQRIVHFKVAEAKR